MSWRHLPAQWLATIYVASVSMLLFFWIGRVLGPAGFGQYNVALTWAAFLGLLLDAGYKTLIFRHETGGLAAGEMVRRAFGHLGIMLLIGLAACFFLWPAAGWLPLGVLAYVAANTLANFYSAYLKGHGRFQDEAKWQVGCRSVSALIIVALLVMVPSIGGIFFAWAIALLAWLSRKGTWLSGHPPVVSHEWAQYRPVLAFLIIDVSTTIYFRIDVILLDRLDVAAAEIGQYSLAYKVLEGIALLMTPVAQIFFREMRLSWLSGQRLTNQVVLFLGASALLAGLLTLVTFLFGEGVVVSLLGESYRGMGQVLPWLMLSLCFVLPNAFLTQLALATEREWFYAGAAMLAAGVNIALNMMLIPGYGIFGATWATIVTEGVLMLALLLAMKKRR